MTLFRSLPLLITGLLILVIGGFAWGAYIQVRNVTLGAAAAHLESATVQLAAALRAGVPQRTAEVRGPARSEEHTSELQSLRHLVCRLLLDPAPTDIYTLSLHDALPISPASHHRSADPGDLRLRLGGLHPGAQRDARRRRRAPGERDGATGSRLESRCPATHRRGARAGQIGRAHV